MIKSIKLFTACLICMPVTVAAQLPDSTMTHQQKAVIAYGRDIAFGINESTTATAVVGEKELSHKKSINNSNSLFGLIPGLQVMQEGSNAWDDSAAMTVRQLSPLVLVDGFVRSLDNLSADEIESITVLKDAPSTALYGMKGANGVVLVRTKRGMNSKPVINFSYQFNVATPNRLPDMVDGYTYAQALNEALINDGMQPCYSADELEAFRTQSNPEVYPNVNWWDEAIRDHSTGNNLTFSVRGGNQSVKYFTQLNYLNDNGILKPTDYNDYSTQFKYSKLNIRTNLDISLGSDTQVQLNLFGNFSEHNRPGDSGIFSALYKVPSGAFPIKTKHDIWGGTNVYGNNPIGLIAGRGYARSQTRTLFADMTLSHDLNRLVKGLSVGAKIGLDNGASYWDNNTKLFGCEQATVNPETNETVYTNLRNEGNLAFSKSVGASTNHFYFEAYTNYAQQWGDHRLTATLQYHMDKTFSKGQNNSRAFIDVVGQAHYVYKHRYIIDASLSASASSVLDPKRCWGAFPSLGLAWVMSEEEAFKADWLNLLKWRASYGIAGTAGYSTDLYLDMFGTGGSYYFGSTPAAISGLKITQLGNKDLTYIKSNKLNVGVDAIIANKLSVTLDGFYDRRSDMFASGANLVSSVFGLSVPNINNGIVDFFGVETSIRWQDRIGDFSYTLGGMLTFNDSKLINVNEVYRPYDYLKRTGRRNGQIFGYEVEGIYQSQQEIDEREVKQNFSEVRPGDYRYKDQNNDGVVDSYDEVALGYSNLPNIYYSFDLNLEYKGFGIYTMWQGTGQQSRVLSLPSVYDPIANHATITNDYYNNRWTESNPNAKYPRLTSVGSKNNTVNHSRRIADASFLKLRTLEVYYNLSTDLLRRTKYIKGGKVFARTHDLLCFDKIKLVDPEWIGATHPTMTQYVLGFNLTF